jgi:hypothetical protein
VALSSETPWRTKMRPTRSVSSLTLTVCGIGVY